MSVDDLPLPGNAVAHALEVDLPGVAAWMLPIAWDAAAIGAVEPMLADAERARAARFSRPGLRERYIAGRATLRMLLGRALGADAARVPIVRGDRGRPRLDLPGAPDFNVSHTRDAALIAILSPARDRGDGAPRAARIGVDLERADREVDAAGLARKFCTARERAALSALDADAARRRFLRLWTCKEAMSKATGDGIGAPMGRMGVDVDADVFRLVEGPAPYSAPDWRLAAIGAPGSHFATAALWMPR